MHPETKQAVEQERAAVNLRNWRTVDIGDLRNACRYFEGAVLLLLQRMAMSSHVKESTR